MGSRVQSRSTVEDGPVAAKLVKADSDGAGYPWRTVQRAADRIGVERRKLGLREGWVWALAPDSGGRRRHEGVKEGEVGMEAGTDEGKRAKKRAWTMGKRG